MLDFAESRERKSPRSLPYLTAFSKFPDSNLDSNTRVASAGMVDLNAPGGGNIMCTFFTIQGVEWFDILLLDVLSNVDDVLDTFVNLTRYLPEGKPASSLHSDHAPGSAAISDKHAASQTRESFTFATAIS